MEEEISDDGLVELRYFNLDVKTERDDVNERTILGITGHVLMTADRIRTMVGIPGAEYVLEIEVKVLPMPELEIVSQPAPRNYEDSFILPRVILEENGVVNALRSVYDDLMNIQGFAHSESFELVKLN